MRNGVRMLWHAIRHDAKTDSWFWRLLLLVLVFDASAWVLGDIVGPRWSVVPAVGVLAVLLLALVHLWRMRRADRQIATHGWENFLDGREELGEYEELGGQYEPATDADEDDDR